MSKKSHKTSFGNKGKDALATSYGEMLLRGQPMERRKSVHITNEPKLKPRARVAFGRKGDAAGNGGDDEADRIMSKRRKWKAFVVWGFAVAMIGLTVSMVFNNGVYGV